MRDRTAPETTMRLVPGILGQSLGILALSAVLALAVNAARPDGLPLVQAAQSAAQSAVQLSQSGGEIALKDAALLFLSGRAVFLDARSQYEFEQGHIQGALNLPPREFASQFQGLKPRLVGTEAVIAYCDGEGCQLSQALAEHLRGAGLKNVYVLKNGWSLWQAEKLPVAKGPAGQKAQKIQVAPKAQKGQPSQSGQSSQSGKTLSLKAPGQDALCTDCAN
ncbi:MAG: rhodanese [Desulfovibrio sp.]|nr:rhodanese [Desulfovibrio sp.]